MGFLRGILGVHSIDQIAYEVFFSFFSAKSASPMWKRCRILNNYQNHPPINLTYLKRFICDTKPFSDLLDASFPTSTCYIDPTYANFLHLNFNFIGHWMLHYSGEIPPPPLKDASCSKPDVSSAELPKLHTPVPI